MTLERFEVRRSAGASPAVFGAMGEQHTAPRQENRLAGETSPYLQQHRYNPVDWYPWGEEALERARAEDRPILLSVGYSACHWCHVMERESFEDPETARIMNEHYVNIKVDREERPDIDSLYMTAVQQMTGRGGWPMTVFLTPAGEPFYGGTYYPPEPRHGMPSFRQVLAAISDAYRTRRDEVERSATEMHTLLVQHAQLRAPGSGIDPALLDRAYRGFAPRFDPLHGGFGAAPKFPQPMTLEFLLRHWARTGSPDARGMAEHTLLQMADGGMYDQLGGGFHRYSVDAKWLVPHFEKMLYDNALLARLYLHAWQATGTPRYREIVEEILGYVQREMTSPEGGFYSAQDADSEGEEGKFYVWSAGEIDAVLGETDGRLFRSAYGVTEAGNFEGRNILHRAKAIEDVAAEAGLEPDGAREALERARGSLYRARADREWPGRDEKVITAWNAMMVQAFAEAGRILDDAAYREVAVRAAEFLLDRLRPDGKLQRTYRDGIAKIPAFLDDHALLADALVSVYEGTWEVRWVVEARRLADEMIERFWDDEREVFFDSAADTQGLVVRARDLYDNATPSGTSAATLVLLRLGSLTGEERYTRVARRAIESVGRLLEEIPLGFGRMLAALDFHLSPPREVAVVGQREDAGTRELLRVLAHRYLPNVVLAFAEPDDVESASEAVPLLVGRTLVDGSSAAYVCQQYACRMPVTGPAELEGELLSQ
jgi:uncharacterized protein